MGANDVVLMEFFLLACFHWFLSQLRTRFAPLRANFGPVHTNFGPHRSFSYKFWQGSRAHAPTTLALSNWPLAFGRAVYWDQTHKYREIIETGLLINRSVEHGRRINPETSHEIPDEFPSTFVKHDIKENGNTPCFMFFETSEFLEFPDAFFFSHNVFKRLDALPNSEKHAFHIYSHQIRLEVFQ